MPAGSAGQVPRTRWIDRSAIVSGMDPLVVATWGLVVATLTLASVSVLQYRSIRQQGKDQAADSSRRNQRQTEQLDALDRQATALAASAKASQAMADELRATRVAANPLRLRLDRRAASPGMFEGAIYNDAERAVIVKLVQFAIGEGVEPFTENRYGNAYLSPGSNPGGLFLSQQFPTDQGDLLVVRVTGRPADGLEQTAEFLYRITPDHTPEDLGPPGTVWTAA